MIEPFPVAFVLITCESSLNTAFIVTVLPAVAMAGIWKEYSFVFPVGVAANGLPVKLPVIVGEPAFI